MDAMNEDADKEKPGHDFGHGYGPGSAESGQADSLAESSPDGGGGGLILKEEVYQIVGCAFAVLNELGHCGKEKIYENAITVEMKARGIPFEQQRQWPVYYREEKVGFVVPDLVAFDSVIVDTKVVPEISDRERWQMLNYLRITRLRVGVILNFYRPKLEWTRLVL